MHQNGDVVRSVITEPGFVGEIDSGKQFPGFSSFPASARENFVDKAMRSSIEQAPGSEEDPPPEPFRVGVSPSTRPEVELDDLDPMRVVSDGN